MKFTSISTMFFQFKLKDYHNKALKDLQRKKNNCLLSFHREKKGNNTACFTLSKKLSIFFYISTLLSLSN